MIGFVFVEFYIYTYYRNSSHFQQVAFKNAKHNRKALQSRQNYHPDLNPTRLVNHTSLRFSNHKPLKPQLLFVQCWYQSCVVYVLKTTMGRLDQQFQDIDTLKLLDNTFRSYLSWLVHKCIETAS